MAQNETEDMEALLAQMDKEYEEEENKKKSKKKVGKKVQSDKVTNETGEAAEADNDSEKKEINKKAANKKTADKKPVKDKPKQVEKKEEPVEIKKQPEEEESQEKEDKKKKGKDKKGAKEIKEKEVETVKEEKEEPVTSGGGKKGAAGKDAAKKKGNAAVSKIKAALAKQQEIEDEIKRQEEEKIRKEEEERQRKLEEERKEKEKKEKKKLKDKQRIERQKAEGTYKSKTEKEKSKRALLLLGIQQLPESGAPIIATAAAEAIGIKPEDLVIKTTQEKKVKYDRLRKKQTQQQQQQQQQQDEEQQQEKKVEELKEKLEEVKIQQVKDEWDASTEEEDNVPAVTTSKVQNVTKKETIDSEGESVTEEEEEESEEEETEEEEEEETSDEEDDLEIDGNYTSIEKAKILIQKRHEKAEKEKSLNNLRSPIICVLGHVDTGKTKILDNLRRTHVQEDEAGGITQQIGATNVPLETLIERTKMCKETILKGEEGDIKIPGLLIIDTPGHESFKSLRNRGSSMCDLAILVIDIMHGLEPQTIESINILKEKKCPFIVALNKIDRLFGWSKKPDQDVEQVLKQQATNTQLEFEKRTNEIKLQLAEQGLNSSLYFDNPDVRTYISLVPTSAHTSDGMGNLIALLIKISQTLLAKRVQYSNELQCSVLEVKMIPSIGTTIDVCLVNGKLRVCDTIVIAGQEGPIVTQIRGLLMPAPNRELRVKNSFMTYKEIKGSQGIKIAAKNLEKAMPGLPLFVAKNNNEIDYYKEELQVMLKQVLSSIKLSDVGVFVQASTLGSLEALLDFLRTNKIPYAGINIGPVHKKDVTKASIMLEKQDPQYACILAFDVKVEREAQELADREGVKIFTADIIYHLFDKFTGYREDLKRKKKEEFKDIAVFPCKLKILSECIFNTRDPIIVGVRIESGFLRLGTPILAITEYNKDLHQDPRDRFIDLGRITSIEFNHKSLEQAKTGNEVCIRIDNTTGGAPKLLGRHFQQTDLLASKITRESIDAVKNYFREDMTKADWELIIELKKLFGVI